MHRQFLFALIVLVMMAAIPPVAMAQTSGIPPQVAQPWLCPFEILFSTPTPGSFGGIWPPLMDGDIGSDRGYVVARNNQLVQPFGLPETFAPVDYGLDALFELNCYPATKAFVPLMLFSVKKGFSSAALNTQISDGDLLAVWQDWLTLTDGPARNICFIVARNRDLVGRFGMMPPVTDMGLDAVFIPHYLPVADSVMPPEIWFSTNRGWWDEKLSRAISPGDLLSSYGYVVATNAQLLRNFHPMPPLEDMGLDAVFVPRYRPWYDSVLPPEIWFSTNQGWFDKKLGHIDDGDLLSTSGKIVRTNAQLMAGFPNPTMIPIMKNYGLDAVYVRARHLIAIDPPGRSLPKIRGNIIRFIFDGPVPDVAGSPLCVGSPTAPQGVLEAIDLASSMFDVTVAATHTAGDTLVLTERDAALSDTDACMLAPSDALDVAPFVADVQKRVGDISRDGAVNIGDLQQLVATWAQSRDSGSFNTYGDLNSDGVVNISDLQLLVANWGR